ncbi:hypothetical protein PHPALM_31223 [Phytophthora palmivora]|uniref:Peptidase A2 domain-containing protein n=1 Tax=Phytophthora palmivora TaxID=4796 RepID=A0A2P4X350_9STRA|nr:hypothetical protein PHPALM_31223 [Phytophthora palmivora]
MKVYEVKTKMSPAVRNWRDYYKSRVSESGKYYTVKQCKDETALAFLYRLNWRPNAQTCVSGCPSVDYVLKQQEGVNPSGAHSGRGAQPRDFRADNVAPNGPRMNRPNRAYVVHDDEAQGSDFQQPFEDDERVDLAALSTCGQDDLRDGNPDAMLLTREDLIHEVYRVMNSCKKWGHRPENRWAVIVCDHSQRQRHPTQKCETKACLNCDQIHDESCEVWRTFQEIKKLLQQGGLADLPSRIREDILNSKGDSKGAQPPLPAEPKGPAQFKLNFGERYGWWAHHDEKEDKQQVATVHGAVNDFRTQVLLDTGATVSMISLDLARRLKLKLNSQKRIKVSGLGGVPTYITASTQIKITLGRRVVYILDVWVTNIGEGVDVVLGMELMYTLECGYVSVKERWHFLMRSLF